MVELLYYAVFLHKNFCNKEWYNAGCSATILANLTNCVYRVMFLHRYDIIVFMFESWY